MTHANAVRVLIPTLLVTALAVLGCAGVGEPEPKPVPHEAPKAGKGDIKVGASSIERRGGAPEKLPSNGTVQRSHVKDQYIVKLAPGVTRMEFRQGLKTDNGKLDQDLDSLGVDDARPVHRHGAKNKGSADAFGLGRTIRFRSRKPADEVVATLEANPDVEWVEPVSEVRTHGKVPNDPYWVYQWNMQNLRVNDAWSKSMGQGVVVAVVDTGVTANEDGFFELLQGHDFVEDDDRPDDMNGHGSHVAGTIGQRSNNGIGVAGVAPKVSILPVRVLDANGSGDNTSVAEGIIWAVDNGANIINLSLGGPSPSEAIADAVAYAYENNVTVVAATGNDGFTDFIGYPAAYRTPIAVGSVDMGNTVAFYSNQGREIDIVGPGGDTSGDRNGDGQPDGVLQETRMNGSWGYYELQGTSMATPHVAGVAALVYANGVHDPDDIRDVLQNTASDLGAPGWDSVYGWGLVNPVDALNASPGAHHGRRGKRGAGGDLEISEVDVKKTGPRRAVISWVTSEPSQSVVSNPNNEFERRDDNMTKFHQVAVRGRPGTSVDFVVKSVAGPKNRAKETVSVTF